jgi:hypothetical protein
MDPIGLGLSALSWLLKKENRALIKKIVIGIGAVILLCLVHRDGTVRERHKWEARLDAVVHERVVRWQHAAEEANRRYLESNQRNEENEKRIKEAFDEVEKLKSHGIVVPESVTGRLRLLK